MSCKNCSYDMEPNETYCAKCGSISHIIKDNQKGKLIIRFGKTMPIGVMLILIGITLMVIFIIFFSSLTILLGLGGASIVFGFIFIAQFKDTINTVRLSSDDNDFYSAYKCKYCSRPLHSDANYCTFCGSKVKQIHEK